MPAHVMQKVNPRLFSASANAGETGTIHRTRAFRPSYFREPPEERRARASKTNLRQGEQKLLDAYNALPEQEKHRRGIYKTIGTSQSRNRYLDTLIAAGLLPEMGQVPSLELTDDEIAECEARRDEVFRANEAARLEQPQPAKTFKQEEREFRRAYIREGARSLRNVLNKGERRELKLVARRLDAIQASMGEMCRA